MSQVVVPDDYPVVFRSSQAWGRLSAIASDVRWFDSLPASEEELIERCAGAEAVVNIRSSARFPRSVLERLSALRILSIWGTGTDHVDLPAASELGITVTNTPGVSAVSIAEHCLALMLAVARRIPQTDREVRQGNWPRGGMVQMAGKTLGIVGTGAIGRRFAELGRAIGMKLLTWSRNPKPELGFPRVELDHLLAESDVVSLHLRLTPETHHFIGHRQLAAMKPGGILLNSARGPVVDERALLELLQSGHLLGAGLDVFETEPLPKNHPLAQIETVVLSPHSAGITPEALEAGLEMAVENIRRFWEGRAENVVR